MHGNGLYKKKTTKVKKQTKTKQNKKQTKVVYTERESERGTRL